jgi:flagellar hook-length control protein FliK
LLAAASNSSKKTPSQPQQSTAAASSSDDSETGTPSALANVLAQASQSSTAIKTQPPSQSSPGTSGGNGTAGGTASGGATSSSTQTATYEINLAASGSSIPPASANNATSLTAGSSVNLIGRLTNAALQSTSTGTDQSPAAAAASDESAAETSAAASDALADGSSADATLLPSPTQPGGASPASPSKANGSSDQPAAAKLPTTADQSTAGVSLPAGSNAPAQPAAASTHATGTTTSDSQQRTQELVDRVASNLRTAFDTGGQLRMRLEPPALGKVQVEVASGNSGLTARMEVQTPAARQTLLDNISLLHTAITQTGASVSRIEVVVAPQLKDDSTSDQQSSSGGQQQASTQGDAQGGSQNQPDGQKQNRGGERTSSIDQLDIEV